MRLQLALNVRDIDEAVEYYSKLFDAEPHKRRDGYANFALSNPPLKLVLFENSAARDRLNHLGVELTDAAGLEAVSRRLDAAGIRTRKETASTCCHATQDKVWSAEPQGLAWEWYRITDDAPAPAAGMPGRGCCTPGEVSTAVG